MSVLRDWTTTNFVALSALVVAGGVCVTDLARSLSVEAPPAVTAPVVQPMPRLADDGDADGASARSVATAVELDPFLTDRIAGQDEYAAEEAEGEVYSEIPITSAAPAAPAFKLQGIAVMPSGAALAVVSVDGRPAQLLRVGQLVADGLRVTRIERGSATLAGPDTAIVLRLPGATSVVSQGAPQPAPRIAASAAGGTRP